MELTCLSFGMILTVSLHMDYIDIDSIKLRQLAYFRLIPHTLHGLCFSKKHSLVNILERFRSNFSALSSDANIVSRINVLGLYIFCENIMRVGFWSSLLLQ